MLKKEYFPSIFINRSGWKNEKRSRGKEDTKKKKKEEIVKLKQRG